MIYGGIGSRKAPIERRYQAHTFAKYMAEQGATLRSGHAAGMDEAFERGAGWAAEIYLPFKNFRPEHRIVADYVQDEPTLRAYEIAEQFHPAWDRLGHTARAFHARNSHQVLGRDCETPVDAVVCWTPGGADVGGTAQAIRIARHHGIRVFNLEMEDDVQAIKKLYGAPIDLGAPLLGRLF